MRSPVSQRQNIWFSKVTEEKNKTNTIQKYGNPVLAKLTVSSGAGTPAQISAGLVVDYDREIISYHPGLRKQISEGDVCWVDVSPELSDDGNLQMSADGVTPTTPPDYRVEKIFSTVRGKIDIFGIKQIGGNYLLNR